MGQTTALVGESGSGKTTLALAITRSLPPAARVSGGEILYNGGGSAVNLLNLQEKELNNYRWREIAIIYQSALNAFNPVLTIKDHFIETVKAHNRSAKSDEILERARYLLNLVALEPDRVLRSYPHELSGGMRQRSFIALSLLLNPKVLILDEPTTALDVLTQDNIINILKDIKRKLNITMIFVTHDLALAAEIADRIAVMYAGRIVELADVYEIFYNPRHPYTIGLLKSIPSLSKELGELTPIPGSPPDLVQLPSGCKFHPRCPYADEECREEEPVLMDIAPNHMVACHKWRVVRYQH